MCRTTWRSINPNRNRYRGYILLVDENLWGNPCVVRSWGRIGSEHLRERYVWPASEAELKHRDKTIGWLQGQVEENKHEQDEFQQLALPDPARRPWWRRISEVHG